MKSAEQGCCGIGIAILPEHGQNELAFMKHADGAMCFSKGRGQNCFTVYHEELAKIMKGGYVYNAVLLFRYLVILFLVQGVPSYGKKAKKY